MNQVDSIEFFTFATFGEDGCYRDYSIKYQAVKENLAEFGINVRLVTLEDLEDLLSINQKELLKLDKGAGYWTWKPSVLEYALKNSGCDGVVYLDCDLVFHADPSQIILNALKNAEIAAYRQNVLLHQNTSKKCLKYFDITKYSREYMWTASLIAMRNDSLNVNNFLSRWSFYCGNEGLLVDPIYDFSMKHRHDQSIFSCLINHSKVDIFDLGNGFYSKGDENRNVIDSDILISHGEVSKNGGKRRYAFKNWMAFIYHKIIYAYWILLKMKRVT